jgi:hypothetical protein
MQSGRFRLASAAVLALSLGACAGIEPEPCTSDWFEYQGRAAFLEMRVDLRDTIRDLKAVARELEGDEVTPWGAMKLVTALPKLAKLFEAFEVSVQPRLERIAKECGRPEVVREALIDFLQDEGLEDIAESFKAFDAIINARNAATT